MSRSMSHGVTGVVFALAAMLGACAQGATGSLVPQPPSKPAATTTASTQTREVTPQPASFAEWRATFRTRALAAGISEQTFDAAFRGVRVNQRVLELDSRQPEFSRPIWEYLDSAVSATRVANGQRNARNKAAVLEGIQQRHGVDFPVVLAVWGLESGFGGNFGSIPVIESMATLAYDGRRRQFAEEQLVAALRILQAGDITPGRMVGSWAGAMGHTQFIPTSFLEYAVDFTGDGRRDLWADDAVDALASTANYLSRFGWRLGEPAAIEVSLPDGFDYLQASPSVTATATDWSARGIRPARGGALPADDRISILLPAGARGPAFAIYPNFGVIKRYNNSTSYALAIAHLADRIRGEPAFAGTWPRGDRTLSRTEKQELQTRLTALGFDTDGIDGIIGPNSRKAVRAFQSARGLVPDGYVSAALLSSVRAAGG
ncbi:MAG: lytic murein transglycosylase [Paracoccaceae bacterium]|mgnify:CR=1 FL=1